MSINNNKLITKILNNHHTVVRKITVGGEDYEFEFKPLTNKELNSLEKLSMNGVEIQIDPNTGEFSKKTSTIDASLMQNNNIEIIKQAIYYSLGIKKDIVDSLPSGLPQLLYDNIIDISTINKSEVKELESFRKNESK